MKYKSINRRTAGYAAIGAFSLTIAGIVAYFVGQGGRRPQNPAEISAKGWKRALLRTKDAIADKDLSMLAAGVAYYGVLAFFPTLVALVSAYTLVADPSQVVAAAGATQQYVPPEIAKLITSQLVPLTTNHQASIIGGLIAGAIALFSASGGMQNLIKALNHAYGVSETRNFIKLRAISLGLILVVIILAVPMTALVLVKGSFLANAGVAHWLVSVILVGRWLLLALLITLLLAAFYRYAPDRGKPRWQIVTWGSTAATLIWLAGTAGFFLYVHYLANFSKSYGIFAGLIILMTWLNLSAFIILIGAAVNNHLEDQTGVVPK